MGPKGSRALPPPLRSMCQAGSLQPTVQRPLVALGRRGGSISGLWAREEAEGRDLKTGGEFSSFLGEGCVEKALEVWPGGTCYCLCACRDHRGRGILPKTLSGPALSWTRMFEMPRPALEGSIARAFCSFSEQPCLGLLVSHRATGSQATCPII